MKLQDQPLTIRTLKKRFSTVPGCSPALPRWPCTSQKERNRVQGDVLKCSGVYRSCRTSRHSGGPHSDPQTNWADLVFMTVWMCCFLFPLPVSPAVACFLLILRRFWRVWEPHLASPCWSEFCSKLAFLSFELNAKGQWRWPHCVVHVFASKFQCVWQPLKQQWPEKTVGVPSSFKGHQEDWVSVFVRKWPHFLHWNKSES